MLRGRDDVRGNNEEEDVSYYSSTASHRSPAIYAKKRMSATRLPRKYHKRSVSENATATTAGAFDFTSWPDDKGAAPAASSSKSAGSSAASADQQASPILTHHQTISLGGIYSLAWVPRKLTRGAFGNVLATGHAAGLLSLVLLPDPYTNNGPAEIVTRFNHTLHVPTERQTSSRVRTINIAPESWSCTPNAAVISMFSEHLFVWDPERHTAPILMQRTKRARALHTAPNRNGIVALATDRGISIMDMRFKRPVALAPPHDNDGFVSHVRWAALDDNKVASVHDSTLIKIWDIRTGSPLVCLEGHYDKINAIEWSTTVGQPEELYSASSDGTVRLWDINKCTDMGMMIQWPSTEARFHQRQHLQPLLKIKRVIVAHAVSKMRGSTGCPPNPGGCTARGSLVKIPCPLTTTSSITKTRTRRAPRFFLIIRSFWVLRWLTCTRAPVRVSQSGRI